MLFQTSDETLWFDREEHLRRVSPPPTDCVVHPSTSAHALRARRCPRSQLALSGPKEISWLQKHLEVVRLREEFGLPFPSFSVFCLSLTSVCFSIWQIQTPQLSVCFPEPRGSFSNLQASQTETCFPLFKKKVSLGLSLSLESYSGSFCITWTFFSMITWWKKHKNGSRFV